MMGFSLNPSLLVRLTDRLLKVVKLENLFETTARVVEDIKFVMSCSGVPIYVARERKDITSTWIRILSFVQGMNPQKSETSMDAEDGDESIPLPFILGYALAEIHSYLVGGAHSDVSSEEVKNDTGCSPLRQDLEDPYNKITSAVTKRDCASIPSSVFWLTFECLRAVDSWLVLDDGLSRISSFLSSFTKTMSKSSEEQLTSTSEVPGMHSMISQDSIVNLDSGKYMGLEAGGSGSDVISTKTKCDPRSLKLLSLSEWPDIAFDVSSQDISFHIPFHRLLSMVLQRFLRDCYGEPAPLNVQAATSGGLSSTTFFSNFLWGCHPYGFSAFLMLHPLRIRMFFAHVRAGLWHGNSDAANVSCIKYHSARWSEKGLELDLFLLQCCAALAPPDLYVKRILECYGVSKYLKLNLERSSEYEPILVQEMLKLIIQIVKERRFCGLTTAECVRRELVYRLCIGDATYSQLIESVPQDLVKIGDLQQILDSVAVYSNPSGLNQGTYKLRLECWNELDLYHPRFDSGDLQMAEERYLSFLKTSAVTVQLPYWSKIYQALGGIARIATCETTLQIVRTILFYAAFPDESITSHAPGGELLTAMHLISLALSICSMHRTSDQSFPILEFACEEIPSSMHDHQNLLSIIVILMRLHQKESYESYAEAVHSNISSLCDNVLKKFGQLEPRCLIKLQKLAPEVVNQLSECKSNPNDSLASDRENRKAKAREMQAAVSKKMKAQQLDFLATVSQEADVSECGEHLVDNEDLPDSKDQEEFVCSLCHNTGSKKPACFIIHLQKSRVLSILDGGTVSWEHSSQSKGGHLSPRESAISTSLLKSNASDSSHLELTRLVQGAVNSFASDSQPHEINAFLGFVNFHFPSVRNIDRPLISQDDLVKTSSVENMEEHMYSLARENLISKFLQKDIQKYGDDFSISGGTQDISSQSLLLGKYIASIANEITDKPSGSDNLHSSHNEAQSSDSIRTHTYDGFGSPDFDGIYLSSCEHVVHQDCLERYQSSLKDRYVTGIKFEGSRIVDLDKGEFLCPVCRRLANSALPTPPSRLPVFQNLIASDSEIVSASPSRAVDSLRIQEAACLMESAASIAGNKELVKLISLQQFEREKSNLDSLFHDLRSLYFPSEGRIYESGRLSNSLLLWDMLKYSIVSSEISARSGKLISTYGSDYELDYSNRYILSMLLNIVQGSRTENVPTTLLRFRGILLFVETLRMGSSSVEQNRQEGDLLSLLEMSDSEVKCLDIQFWKRVSDPVLAHESFSSLMWAFFCLPTTFLSCKESFLCLVHIFYLVTVIQAIMIFCRNQRCSLSGLKDSLICDICKVIRDKDVIFQFNSAHIDTSCEIKDVIRSLTSTFLRRCSLLWELVDSNHRDIAEIEGLELKFRIPPIGMVVSDDISRSMAVRWLHHFSTEFKHQRQRQNVLYCAPSVPFSLIVLPSLYEDVFIKYIYQWCSDCGADLEEPALCLLCGKLCTSPCDGKTCCCREIACRAHAVGCGAGIGVYLLIRRTVVYLFRAARVTEWPSPYLDANGEEDYNLSRGKPLFLNAERYAALTRMVASHGLDRNSRVLRGTNRYR